MTKNKGGAPSVPKKKLTKDLQSLALFNRDSSVYVTIESELEALTPAKAFDLFCHYCAKRDKPDAYALVEDMPHRLKKIVQRRKNMLPATKDLIKPLKKLSELSEHIFVNYMDLHCLDYTLSNNNDDSSNNNFSFDISASFSWGYISHYYSEEQREKVYEHIFNEHIQLSEELKVIYENTSDKASVKALHTLLILNNQKVNITDVTDNMMSPFYLEDRNKLESMLKVDRYSDVEYAVSELAPKNASKAISYKPNATIQLNMDKPIEYIEEMLFALKDDWTKNNSSLMGKELVATPKNKKHAPDTVGLRRTVMRFNKKQKTLAGKLTDLLYVYDCRKFGFTNPWTTDQIYGYWKKKIPKGKHGDSMSSSTHNNYLQLINIIINQKYYKNY